MKILFPLSVFYPSQNGGPANTVYWHTCALKEMAVDSTIITTSRGIDCSAELQRGVFLDKPCGRVYYSDENKISLSTLGVINKEVKNNSIIHLNSLFDIAAINTFFFTRLFYPRKKIVWSTRGELSEDALKFSKHKKRILLSIYKKVNSNVLFHSTSDAETSAIKMNFPKRKIAQIPNLMKSYKRLNLKKERTIVYLGRIHPIKKIENLIQAFSQCHSHTLSNFRINIYGQAFPGQERYLQYLKVLIKELNLENKIIFKGHIRGIEKEEALSRAYMLVLPSASENFGNVVIEALNQGTPVIASKGTPWSILEKYNSGYHVDNNPKSLARAMDKLSSLKSNEYEEISTNCFNLLDDNFSVDTQIAKWEKVYKSLIHNN